MNHQSLTTTDFRYLNVFAPSHRVEIERGLAEMGTPKEVISWVFTQLDDLKAEYTEQLSALGRELDFHETHYLQ